MENSEKNLIKILLCSLFFILFCFKSYSANKRIQSFSKSKKIMFNIYKSNQNTFYCGCSYKNKIPNHKSCGYRTYKNEKRASRVEWEHILPASRFGKKFDTWRYGHKKCVKNNGKKFKGRKCTEKVHKKYRLIQADLYNLQPVIGEINGMRSNYKMSIIKGEKRNYGKCDIEFKNKLVEPSEKIRGDIARTYFYMAETYPEFIKLSKKELNLFYEWDHNDPVDKWECIRSKLIKNIQGNINNVIETRCKINEILQN